MSRQLKFLTVSVFFLIFSAPASLGQYEPAYADDREPFFAMGLGGAIGGTLSYGTSYNFGTFTGDRLWQIATNHQAGLSGGNHFVHALSVGPSLTRFEYLSGVYPTILPAFMIGIDTDPFKVYYTVGVVANLRIVATPISGVALVFDVIGMANRYIVSTGFRMGFVVTASRYFPG